MTETIKKVENNCVEVTNTYEEKRIVSESDLLARKADLQAQIDKIDSYLAELNK